MNTPGRNLSRILPLLALANLALLAGLWTGLARLGWPVNAEAVSMLHGPLMVSGFLGTLIALERAAAMRKGWMFLAPLLSGLGWIAATVFPEMRLGAGLITVGSLIMVGILAVMVRRDPSLHTVVMAVGTLAWLIGNIFWLMGWPINSFVLFWAAFLVLTISGERLELSRVLRMTSRKRALFLAVVGVFVAGVIAAPFLPQIGARIAGAGMLALGAWLIRYDIARRNIRHPAPLTRYIAMCLFAGMIWLCIAGLLLILLGHQAAGAYYDVVLHSLFVGFAISMIFGHAPIILPAFTGLPIVYRQVFYAPLGLLHGSLILRIAGDLAGSPAARKWGGLLNEVAILLFLAVTAWSLYQSRRR